MVWIQTGLSGLVLHLDSDWMGGKWVLRTYGLICIGFRVQTVWIGMVRSLHSPHIKSRILEIKYHVHTIKFYQN